MLQYRQLKDIAEKQLGVPNTLHEYQWDGVAFLYRSKHALLADEMGLGKTVQAAIALALLLNDAQSGINRVLIVAPTSLTINWMEELATWTPLLTTRLVQGTSKDRQFFYLLPIPVLVSSYEQIRQDAIDKIPLNSFDLVILDEAQRIKNKNSSTALSCRLLPRTHAWALSATPLENDEEDVVSILRFLDPSFNHFYSKEHLVSKLQSIMLRRYKSQVRSELPPVILQDLNIDLSEQQRAIYDELWINRANAISRNIGSSKVSTALVGLITQLKIICNYDALSNTSSKLDALITFCQGAGSSSKILVFSQFVETLRWISERIEIPHKLLIGSMSAQERQLVVEHFKNVSSPQILLISLRAGGVGLNLEEATHVCMFDRWWNPAAEIQAIYRAHRFSRKEPLHVIRFLIRDSVEEHISSILEKKEALIDEVIESTETYSKRFTTEELMQILQLTPGDIKISETKKEET